MHYFFKSPAFGVALSLGIVLASCGTPHDSSQSSQSSSGQTSEQSSDQTDEGAIANSAELTDFPHQRLELTDDVEPGSEFDQLRQNLGQAVENRDADFVTRLIPSEGVAIGFGRPMAVQDLELDDPNSFFWTILEKAIAPGCAALEGSDYPTVDSGSPVWVCPNVVSAFREQYPPPPDAMGVSYEISKVIVVGEAIQVHAEPNAASKVVGLLSDEVVEFDQQTWDQMPPEARVEQVESINGWTPVILPNDQAGYVANRHAYRPLETQVIFGRVDEQWQIVQVPSGD